jgi:hypothetical protein
MNLNEPSSGNAVPTQPGLYKLSFLQNGEPIFTWEGTMEGMLEDAKLWRHHQLERVFYCDQCSYFNENGQAVQEHSEREHDCRWETYLGRGGAIRVRTVKCHPRLTAPAIGKKADKRGVRV